MNPYLLFNLGVDGFAIAVLFILLYTSIISFDNTMDERFMRRALLMQFLVLLFDFFTWVMIGRPGSTVHFMMNIVIKKYY